MLLCSTLPDPSRSAMKRSLASLRALVAARPLESVVKVGRFVECDVDRG